MGLNTTGSPNIKVSLMLNNTGTKESLLSFLFFEVLPNNIRAINKQIEVPQPPINTNVSMKDFDTI